MPDLLMTMFLSDPTELHLGIDTMSILIDKNTRLICQGITGKSGRSTRSSARITAPISSGG